MLFADLGNFGAGKLVAAFVFAMARVALDPMPVDAVRLAKLIEPPPEVGVPHRLAVPGSPTVPLPGRYPACNAVTQIFRVRVKVHDAGFFERAQCSDRGGQFHPIVGGGRFAASEFFSAPAVLKDRAPAARARVSVTTAIGVDSDGLHRPVISYVACLGREPRGRERQARQKGALTLPGTSAAIRGAPRRGACVPAGRTV
jgi:hypothetical protein